MANMTFKANLLPDNSAAQRELGSSTAKWAINGVADPKLTDTLPTINTTGTGNAITAISISGSTITVTKGASYNNYTYTLPTASSSTKGGIKVGTGLSISSDTLSVSTTSGTSTLAWNSEVTLGTVGGLAIKAKLPSNPNTMPSVTTTGSGNAVTGVSISNTTITVTKGSTFNNYTPFKAINTSVTSATWTTNTSSAELYDVGYIKQAAVQVSGCSTSSYPSVVFSYSDIASGNFAPICQSGDGVIYIYAIKAPSNDIILQSVCYI